MKPLEQFMNEALINEAFGSKILAQILPLGLLKGNWFGRQWQLQWDKITDNMLEELTEEQGRAAYRKRTESPYLLWVTQPSWGKDAGKDTVFLITWGSDVIWYSYGGRYRGESTKALIDSSSVAKVYKVIDAQDYMQREVQQLRAEQKRDALALKSSYTTWQENQKRWQDAKARMHTGSMDEALKMYEDAMNLYAETVKNFIVKYADIIADTDCPSTYIIRDNYKKLTNAVNNLLESISNFKSATGRKPSVSDPKWAKRCFDDISKWANTISEYCTKLTQDQE